MKKLMIALSAVACAVSLNAAQFAWSNGAPINAYGQPGDDGDLATGTMYLMNAATISASSFITQVIGAGSDGYVAKFNELVAGAVNYATLGADGTSFSNPKTSDKVAAGIVTFSGEFAEGMYDFYQVLIDTANNGVYISELVTAEAKGSGKDNIEFWSNGAYGEDGAGNPLYNNPFPAGTTTYDSANGGWYQTVPEPTSGLLLLLGVAGLALRRRRA